MKRDQILSILRFNKPYMEQHFGVKSLGLFGSVAKEKASDESDIDILVELKAPKYDWWAGLLEYLQDKLGKKVDLITTGSHLSEKFLNRVNKEVIYV